MEYTSKRNVFKITCYNSETDNMEELPFFSDHDLSQEFIDNFNYIFNEENYRNVENLIEDFISGANVDGIKKIELIAKEKK